MDQFYYWELGQNTSEKILKLSKSYDDQELLLGKVTPKKLITTVKSGRTFFDTLSYYDAPLNFAVSEKIINALRKAGATGWKTFDISIKGHPEKKYGGFQVSGSCGEINNKKRGEVIGYNFDLKSWDGSDIFCPKNTLLIFCSKKVKDALEAAKVTNLEFIPINEVEWYNYPED